MNSASTSYNGRSTTDTEPMIGQPEIESLPERPLANLTSNAYLHGQQPAENQVIVAHHQQALSQIRAHSVSNLRSELGGVLLGHAYRDGEQLWVEVMAALPARNDDHGPIHFTFTADAWSQIHNERAKTYPNLEIVGWFHTHPGLGVFYSSDDVVVHTAAFTLPWHVGLVVDPLGNTASYFGWQDGELTPIPGYFEQLDVQETPVAPWRVAQTEVWHTRETEEFYASYEERQQESGMLRAAYGQERPLALSNATTLGILGFVIGFFLLFGWVVALNRQINSLESVIVGLADETSLNAAVCTNDQLRILAPTTTGTAEGGQDVPILGTAVLPGAARYQVEFRPVGGEEWKLAGVQRRQTDLGLLTNWDTSELPFGQYDLRLTAVDRQNIPLPNTASCQISVELVAGG
ncbi:Mov34/MPN/PAD-1 family protein [Candidatus Leptofilum sp.]|uniref:Mov34/MPN/PAD-1 family protein n=1 Tax=Candidatus Leptofilum sp. TaxID=3241576 RepID=UPI003B5B74CE